MGSANDSNQRLDRLVRLTRLLDTYGALLTPHQRELCRASWDNDLSLAEIAEDYGISRQAVHDAVRKAGDVLENYESALGLLAQGVDTTAPSRGGGAANDPVDANQSPSPSSSRVHPGSGGRDASPAPEALPAADAAIPSGTALEVAGSLEKIASRVRAQGAVYDARGLAAQLDELVERLRDRG